MVFRRPRAVGVGEHHQSKGRPDPVAPFLVMNAQGVRMSVRVRPGVELRATFVVWGNAGRMIWDAAHGALSNNPWVGVDFGP